MAETCDTCRFFRSQGHLELCCRHAPQPSPSTPYPARVPAVRWCGEWRDGDLTTTHP